jgi:hypothetical protein
MRDTLAALCHEQWAGWMRYLFGRSACTTPAGVLINAEDARRWRRQVETPYAELSHAEQESDRKEADRILAVITPRLTALVKSWEAIAKESHSDPASNAFEQCAFELAALLKG